MRLSLLLLLLASVAWCGAMADDRDYPQGAPDAGVYPPFVESPAGGQPLALSVTPEKGALIWPEPIVFLSCLSGNGPLPPFTVTGLALSPSGQEIPVDFHRGILYGTQVPTEGFLVGCLLQPALDGMYSVRVKVQCMPNGGESFLLESSVQVRLEGYAGAGAPRPMTTFDLRTETSGPSCLNILWSVPLNMEEGGEYLVHMQGAGNGLAGSCQEWLLASGGPYEGQGGSPCAARICGLKPGAYDVKIVSVQANGLASADSNVYTAIVR